MSERRDSGPGLISGVGQLIGSLLITLISLSMLLGGFLLGQRYGAGVSPPPTQATAVKPSPTPSPSLTPPPPSPTPPAGQTTVPPTPAASASPTQLSPTPKPAPSPTLTEPLPPMTACSQPSGWVVYTVQQGDTLAGLARHAGISTGALTRANCLSSPVAQSCQQIWVPPVFHASPTPQSYPSGSPLGWATYVVQAGDTLYSLSRRFNVSIEAMQRANCLTDHTIYVGQRLYLPPTSYPSPAPRPDSRAVPSDWVAYVVQPGDTLYSLSRRFNVSIEAVQRVNYLTNHAIYAGQRLYLAPTSYPSPAPRPDSSAGPSDWVAYVVQLGDTLYSLSRRFNVSVEAVQRANCLTDHTIYGGQRLYFPPTSYASPAPRPDSSAGPSDWVAYIVQPGDTLYSLSHRFSIAIEAIRRANCLSGDTIYAEQALYLPPMPPARSR